jgi:NADPH:quinone reductase-like Zn-dependent oxidoreductase
VVVRSRQECRLSFEEPARDTAASRVGEFDIPEPGAGELTIRVAHVGVNFKDIMARRGDPELASPRLRGRGP